MDALGQHVSHGGAPDCWELLGNADSQARPPTESDALGIETSELCSQALQVILVPAKSLESPLEEASATGIVHPSSSAQP